MPADANTEHDYAGLAYGGTPTPRRGLLARLGLGRTPPIAQHPVNGGMAVVPAHGAEHPQPAPGQVVKPLMPMASANYQLGAYVVPYAVPTAVAPLVSGPQLFCGVETIRRQYLSPMAPGNPAPFFQQTMRPSFPVMTTRDGGRPGNTLGPAGAALTFGPQRQAQADATDSLAANLLGW